MWYAPFWIFFAVSVILAGTVAVIRGFRFVDMQLIIMIAALVLACDMLFCKQYHMYHYVNMDYTGWYSFWACLIIIPLLGYIFIKFVPKSMKGLLLYMVSWSVLFTLFEIYIAEPFGIIHYPKWKVYPYSTIGYVVAFTIEYIYYGLLIKYCKR